MFPVSPRPLLFAALFVIGCGREEPTTCSAAAAEAVVTCIETATTALTGCFDATGATCAKDDAEVAAALQVLAQDLQTTCDNGLGVLDASAAVSRFQQVCDAQSRALVHRLYGGPQGALLANEPSEADRTCLDGAVDASVSHLSTSVRAFAVCLADPDCDPGSLTATREELDDAAEESVTTVCPDLGSLAAVDPPALVRAVNHQVDCSVAATFEGVGDLPINCGPDNAEISGIPRGEWTAIDVDGDRWGTQCGDGSDYQFWIRPAPEGKPLDNVIIMMQGGGVCLFAEDCGAKLAGAPFLFDATGPEDFPFPVGIASNDPSVSPVTDWTAVYLPYCTQDVFAGGGVVEDLGAVQVPRFGSVNMRAAVQMTRDYLWRELDAAGGDGFRPDQVVALVGGFSAGGYGTLFNYHWYLDELQWPQTTAFPDGGLAVDNGQLLGVGSLGEIKIPVWGMRNFLPGYCFEGPCSSGEVLLNAYAPRLQQVPKQNLLLLSNQLDSTQSGDAFFPDDASFINALRQMYCDTRDLPAVHWYLGSESESSVHVISTSDTFMTGEVAGSTLRDYFARAVTEPESLTSHVEEGTFVTDVPGVEPFPCDLTDDGR